MGPDGNTELSTPTTPAVAYNSADNEYLVVWDGDDNTAPLVDNEFEIFGQRLSAPRAPRSAPTTSASPTWGPTATPSFDALDAGGGLQRRQQRVPRRLVRRRRHAPLDDESRSSGSGSTRAGARGRRQRLPHLRHGARRQHRLRRLRAGGGLQRRQQRVPRRLGRRRQHRPARRQRVRDLRAAARRAAGAEVGANDFRISDMGPDGNADLRRLRRRRWPTTPPTTSTSSSGTATTTPARWSTRSTRSSASGSTRTGARGRRQRLPPLRHGPRRRRELRRLLPVRWPTTAPPTSTSSVWYGDDNTGAAASTTSTRSSPGGWANEYRRAVVLRPPVEPCTSSRLGSPACSCLLLVPRLPVRSERAQRPHSRHQSPLPAQRARSGQIPRAARPRRPPRTLPVPSPYPQQPRPAALQALPHSARQLQPQGQDPQPLQVQRPARPPQAAPREVPPGRHRQGHRRQPLRAQTQTLPSSSAELDRQPDNT